MENDGEEHSLCSLNGFSVKSVHHVYYLGAYLQHIDKDLN